MKKILSVLLALVLMLAVSAALADDDTVTDTVTVKVEDAGDGTLAVKYDGNESFTTPEFENEYDAEGKEVSRSYEPA